jgi:CheY-like chemotaxis protein
MPDLFVLDLYFPCGSVNRDEIEALRAEPLSLENDNAEIRPAYRNHLKAGVRLAGILEARKQNADGGLKLAEKVATDYPKVPIVFYSRKATLEDAVRCMAAKNVWWVEKKPTGKDSAETIEMTKSAKQRIAHRFETLITKADSGKVKRLKEAAKVLVDILGQFS